MKRQILCHIVLCLLLVTTAGCVPLLVGAAAGAGGVAYARGALLKNVDYPVKDVHAATVKAAKSLGLYILDDDLDRDRAHFDIEDEEGKNIQITAEALTEQASKIKIRVGTFGDEEYSQIIMDAITDRL